MQSPSEEFKRSVKSGIGVSTPGMIASLLMKDDNFQLTIEDDYAVLRNKSLRLSDHDDLGGGQSES